MGAEILSDDEITVITVPFLGYGQHVRALIEKSASSRRARDWPIRVTEISRSCSDQYLCS
jgi:hypothetical protein